jgi:hypothetical protein
MRVDAASLTLEKHSIKESRYSWPSHGLARLRDLIRPQAAGMRVVPTQEFLVGCLLDWLWLIDGRLVTVVNQRPICRSKKMTCSLCVI